MNPCNRVVSVVVLLLVPSAPSVWADELGSIECAWRVVAGGGGTSTNGDFVLSGTLAQSTAGAATAPGPGGELLIVGGFWLPSISEALPCFGDLDGDGSVGAPDLGLLLAAWGTPERSADLDGDGIVSASDLGLLLGAWGACDATPA